VVMRRGFMSGLVTEKFVCCPGYSHENWHLVRLNHSGEGISTRSHLHGSRNPPDQATSGAPPFEPRAAPYPRETWERPRPTRLTRRVCRRPGGPRLAGTHPL